MAAVDSPEVEDDPGDACGGKPGVGTACRTQGRGCVEVGPAGGRARGPGHAVVVLEAEVEVGASVGATPGWPDS